MSVLSNVSKLPVSNTVEKGRFRDDMARQSCHERFRDLWCVKCRSVLSGTDETARKYLHSLMMSTCEYITIVSCLPECNDNIYCVHNCLQSTVNIKISPPWCILQFHNTVTQHPSYFISTRVCLTDWDFFVTFSLYGNQFLIWIWEDWVECLVWRAWQQSDGDSATTISLHLVCLD